MPKPGTKQESPIAASSEAKSILARLAGELGLPKTVLLDEALRALRDHYDHHRQRLLLPLRFNETFAVTMIDPAKPLILHEPLSRVRSEVMKPGDEVKTRTPARKAASRG